MENYSKLNVVAQASSEEFEIHSAATVEDLIRGYEQQAWHIYYVGLVDGKHVVCVRYLPDQLRGFAGYPFPQNSLAERQIYKLEDYVGADLYVCYEVEADSFEFVVVSDLLFVVESDKFEETGITEFGYRYTLNFAEKTAISIRLTNEEVKQYCKTREDLEKENFTILP